MIIRGYLILGLLLITLQNLSINKSLAQDSSINFQEQDIITEDSEHFYIGNLEGVGLGNEQEIYLVDGMNPKVIKLDAEGNFEEKIIRSGRGPGEVNSAYAFYINPDRNELLVADRQNARMMITDLNGEEQGIIPMRPNEMNTPVGIEHLEGSRYLFLFTLSENQGLRAEKKVDAFFHVYDIKERERLYSFSGRRKTLDELTYSSKGGEIVTSNNVGNILIQDDHMIFAPASYNGKLLRYSLNGSDSKIKEVIEGKKWDRASFKDLLVLEDATPEEFEVEERNMEETIRDPYRFLSEKIKIVGLMNTYSAGLFELGDNSILHFSVNVVGEDNGSYYQLHAELFDEDLNYLGSEMIKEMEKGEIIWGVDTMDEEGNFYMPIQSNEYVGQVIKFSLDIQQE